MGDETPGGSADGPESVDVSLPPSGTGCQECEATNGWWVHLRRCAACGHVGCCDTSPSQHATGHYRDTGHRFIQSFEPGEDWYWDYATEQAGDGPALADPQAHPADQTVPGPRERVPANWRALIH